ncbi:MAG: Fic family protein [Candidatus Omnitrophica bacterium]|nr:Fic family protein [Candidatus Omnitrophota bacterium]
MNSFKTNTPKIPTSAVWLLTDISEYKGKQDLYTRQSPQALKSLLEMALIESTESSNRIEGVTVDHHRLKPLVIGHSKPRDRSEEEIAGYRRALDLIHKNHAKLRINAEMIQELHRLSRGESWDAGKWKEKDNDIIKKYPDGRVEVIFKPVSAKETPKFIEQMCLAYQHTVAQSKFPPLYAVACLILDFLSIHPFRDGNGRVSRLLTLLALYQHGFQVGRYISIERVIEQSKETYYETLNRSSQHWHQAKHDITPWLNYFLGLVLAGYKEFENRAGNVKPLRGAKTTIVENAIKSQIGDFGIADIERQCPGVSRPMIRVVLEQMRDKDLIKSTGTGRSAKWRKT